MGGYSLSAQPTIRSNPNFSKTLIGDFTFDSEREQHRSPLFLQRNMTRVLAYHGKSRTKGPRNLSHALRSSPRVSTAPPEKVSAVDGPAVNGGSADSLDAAAHSLSSASLGISKAFDTSKPEVELASSSTLMAKRKNGEYKPPARRSVRRLQESQYHDQDAELCLNILNIRKKLNFTSNLPPEDERPCKRLKRDWIKCQCHLTIWDNRHETGEGEPIVRKTQMCQVVASETASSGYCVDIELEKVFSFLATDLRVSIDRQDESVLGIIDKYFLEIKIIPTKTEIDWPPIPILGKSDGDHFVGLAKPMAEKLQGALVARYMHLPQAPASDVPLSVFFLHSGRTYRTKYGLEVSAEWTKSGSPGAKVKREPDTSSSIGSWAWDSSGLLFGRNGSVRDGTPSQHSTPFTTSTPEISVRTSYTFDAASSKTAPKEFRRASLIGFGCPACPSMTAQTVQELQFHFLTSHYKYKLIVENESRDPLSDALTAVAFRISPVEAAKPRNIDSLADEENWEWHKPSTPLDLSAFVNGDKSWIGEQPKRRGATNTGASVLQQDPISIIRRQNDGFLPVQHVRDFRKPERKKHPVIELRRRTDDKFSAYTSLSHHRTGLSEEARSETDDEMDDEWFIQRHLESLDLMAKKEGWSDMKRELRKRWDRHRLEERLEHPRYLSDSLVRFVRKEKLWLSNKDKALQTAFGQLLRNMKKTRVINDTVCADVYLMIFEGDAVAPNEQTTTTNEAMTTDVVMKETFTSPYGSMSTVGAPRIPSSTIATALRTEALTPAQLEIEAVLALPPGHCGLCAQPILSMITEAVHCNDANCEAPGAFYHLKCVRRRRKDKLSWTCGFCKKRKKEVKGKGKAVD